MLRHHTFKFIHTWKRFKNLVHHSHRNGQRSNCSQKAAWMSFCNPESHVFYLVLMITRRSSFNGVYYSNATQLRISSIYIPHVNMGCDVIVSFEGQSCYFSSECYMTFSSKCWKRTESWKLIVGGKTDRPQKTESCKNSRKKPRYWNSFLLHLGLLAHIVANRLYVGWRAHGFTLSSLRLQRSVWCSGRATEIIQNNTVNETN